MVDSPTGSVTSHFATGSLVVGCLQPGVPLTVSVLGLQGELVWGPRVVTLDAGELRALEVVVAAPAGR